MRHLDPGQEHRNEDGRLSKSLSMRMAIPKFGLGSGCSTEPPLHSNNPTQPPADRLSEIASAKSEV